ncbi:MAG: hypothetical protein LBV41_05915 [Cytophagaceae bacterium]|nr:hypothetical protein [Cytophagaceae bacterium]
MRIVFVLMIAFVLGVNYCVLYRLWHLMPAYPFSKIMLICAAIVVVSPFISLGLGSYFPSSITAFMHKVGKARLIF